MPRVGEIAADGKRFKPHMVSRIATQDGTVLREFQPELLSQLDVPDYVIRLVQTGLHEVTTYGTAASSFRGFPIPIAGKTGTTNNNSDAWFMGLTPTLVNACWVGGDDRDIHFDTMVMGQGAAMALPIYALYMQKVYADKQLGYTEDAVFDMPEGYDPCSFIGDALETEDNEIEEIFE